MTIQTPIVDPVEDLWPARDAPGELLEELTLASHLLAANRAIANFGGGNTSAKGSTTDHVAREVHTMWVKGSGSDLATIESDQFTALRLEEILPLMDRQTLSDEDMVAHLARCQLDPTMPRASIETLLHAFIAAPHVHHTHPDAINVLAGSVHGEQLLRECFGASAAWVPYLRPGFTLSKQVADAVRTDPRLELIVLAKHGLIVWGESAEECYRRTVEAINRAADFVNERTAGQSRFGGGEQAAENRALLSELLPAIRGALSSERPKVLTVDTSPRALEFVSSAAAPQLVTVGAPCPDHLVHTKRLPLWVPYDPDLDDVRTLRERIAERAERYRSDYRAYFEQHAAAEQTPADPDARIVLVQGLGLVAAGTSTKAAITSRDLYHRAIEVMAGAQALDEFVSLDAAESFAIEYWPLELYKLAQAPPAGEFQGKVALVTGGGGGIGRAIIDELAGADACVVALDLDEESAREAVEKYGDRGLAVGADVTSEAAIADAFGATVRCFGGVDIVVANAGIASSAAIEDTTLDEWNRNFSILGTGCFLAAREAFRLLKEQGRGGAVIVVASKNALAAGKNAAAYSAAKAAELHLARCLAEEGGADGIRVNTVNPDAVLQGSKIWDSSWRRQRAAAYDVSPDDLDELYRQRNALKVSIYPSDIAQAVIHFASERRSGKSTGNLLNVDGGVAAAYAR
ncbi:MAG: bifunctional rhamnulose-1-phosphate aldolase/short-chain dehydrogenase [Solirubrobacterales bacterium]|nr:bifunctional rhamnulose-1-phosphate aldolase/short-chain dehydrogenase [Solirubrobacterales bacterium]